MRSRFSAWFCTETCFKWSTALILSCLSEWDCVEAARIRYELSAFRVLMWLWLIIWAERLEHEKTKYEPKLLAVIRGVSLHAILGAGWICLLVSMLLGTTLISTHRLIIWMMFSPVMKYKGTSKHVYSTFQKVAQGRLLAQCHPTAVRDVVLDLVLAKL